MIDEGQAIDLLYVRGSFSTSIIAIELKAQDDESEVEAVLQRLASRGLAEHTGGRWRLTEPGNRLGHQRKSTQSG